MVTKILELEKISWGINWTLSTLMYKKQVEDKVLAH